MAEKLKLVPVSVDNVTERPHQKTILLPPTPHKRTTTTTHKMIYYIKTTNKQSLYNALVDCGIAREMEDSHALIDGAELSEIGAIVRQEKRFVRGDSGEILFETREELVTEATQEVLWSEDEDLPEGTVAGDVKVPAADAVYKTIKTNTPQMELVFEEVEGEMVPKMSALKMLTLGDIKTPKVSKSPNKF